MKPAILLFLCMTVTPWSVAATIAQIVEEGNAAFESGDYDGALKHYDEAIELDPELPEAHFNRGAALYKKGDMEGAKSAFENAIGQSPSGEVEAQSLYNLGNVHFQEAVQTGEQDPSKAIGHLESGVRRYEEALERKPSMSEAAQNLELSRRMIQTLRELQQQQPPPQQNQQPDKSQSDQDQEEQQSQSGQGQQQEQDGHQEEAESQDQGESETQQQPAGTEQEERTQDSGQDASQGMEQSQSEQSQDSQPQPQKKDSDPGEEERPAEAPGQHADQGDREGDPSAFSEEDTARDILQDEKRLRQRRIEAQNRLAPVGKDW
ncbi:MAG: hypothetical protein AMXMBFR84_23660 [Candidatus Hydrogenedentota bacterium]